MLLAQPANADIVTFDFTAIDGTSFEGPAGGVLTGAPMVAGGMTADLTSVLVTAPEYANGVATGGTVNADLNATGGGNFGVNNPSINNSGYNTIAGVGTGESSNFNFGEVFAFTIDEDVVFTNFDFSSTNGPDDSFDVTINGTTTNFDADTANPFGTTLFTAGTTITFTAAATLQTSNARINSIEVDIPVVIPEPTSLAVLGFGSVLMATRRRRR